MATLKTTIVNGTLNVTNNLNVNRKSVSWMESYETAGIILSDLGNTTGYSSWICQKNSASSVGYSMGVYQNIFNIVGSALPRTNNGWDLKVSIDAKNKLVYADGSIRSGKSIWAGVAESGSENSVGAIGAAGAMYIYSQASTSGKMGIYATTKSNNNVGWMNVTQNGQVSISYTNLTKQSDKRLKNNITDLLDAETKTILVESKIKKFTMKSDLIPGNFQYGVLAQDLRDTLKNNNLGYRSILRITDKETKLNDITDLNYPEEKVEYGVDYTQYIPILIKGWQMHEAKINQLEQRIKELENR